MNFKFIYYCIRVYALSLCYQKMAIDTEQDLIRDIQKHKNPAKKKLFDQEMYVAYLLAGGSLY